MNRFDHLVERDKNSFDFVRFSAAILVIFSHTFYLDPISQSTAGEVVMGRTAVIIFFITSGFLVTMSIDRSQSWAAFVKARFLRIYPALIVVVVLTVFVLGPLMTTLSLGSYFSSPDTYGYFRVLLLRQVTYPLPGVFGSSPRFGNEVNSSLWTLLYEVLAYALVLGLWAIGLLKRRVVLLLF